MSEDSMRALTHPRNTAFEEAFQLGTSEHDMGTPTWPTPYGDTMRGADEALMAEWRKGRFYDFVPQPTPVLMRDAEAIAELSDYEISLESGGKLHNQEELAAWRQAQQQGGPEP